MNEHTAHALTVYNELVDIAAEHNAPHHYAGDLTHDLAILLGYDPRRSFIWHLSQTGSHFAQIPDADAKPQNPNTAADAARHAALARAEASGLRLVAGLAHHDLARRGDPARRDHHRAAAAELLTRCGAAFRLSPGPAPA